MLAKIDLKEEEWLPFKARIDDFLSTSMDKVLQRLQEKRR